MHILRGLQIPYKNKILINELCKEYEVKNIFTDIDEDEINRLFDMFFRNETMASLVFECGIVDNKDSIKTVSVNGKFIYEKRA